MGIENGTVRTKSSDCQYQYQIERTSYLIVNMWLNYVPSPTSRDESVFWLGTKPDVSIYT